MTATMVATKRVLLITTGGTIGGNVAEDPHVPKDGDLALEVRRDAEEFQRMIGSTRKALEVRHRKNIEIETSTVCDIDSSDVKPELWTQLSQAIYENFDDYDAFIITHGTNTLGYTCAALSFAIANSGKPIVLTGSQVPAGDPGTDALVNLENALRVAVWEPPRGKTAWMEGVLAVFGSFIISGTRVKKDTEFDYDAFKSFSIGAVGRIGRIIDINQPNLEKHRGYLETNEYPTAYHRDELRVESEFDMNIASLTEFPGMDPDIFRNLVDHGGISGFILRAFGAGDPAETLRPAFEFLKDREIPIVVTTQAPNGNSNFQVNDPGKWLRDNNMAIPAYDMSIESQTTKLGWLLAKKNRRRELNYKAVCEKMVTDLRGEVSPLWEINR